MVLAGDTVIDWVVAPPGLQRYVPPVPEAVNVAEPPTQMVAEFTVTTGFGFTVTVPEADAVHPAPEVTVTV